MTRILTALLVALPAVAQDKNVVLPVPELERMLGDSFRIASAQVSRPKAQGDITLKAELAFGDRQPIRVKLRRAEPGADTFNNVPRYEQAAYELQKLLLDGSEFVVPPTALRFVPLADLRKYAREAKATFRGADETLCVVQYWLQDVTVVKDVLDEALLQSDPVYERHVGQLNVITYLIRHGDSNAGNFLISASAKGERVFSVDNGVAFNSEESDRGELWRSMRVKRLPRDVIAKLRALTEADLTSRLGVVGQWKLADGHWIAAPAGANLGPGSGVRREGNTLQMGLNKREIGAIRDRAKKLLEMIDEAKIVAF
jgi:hypothetical protein